MKLTRHILLFVVLSGFLCACAPSEQQISSEQPGNPLVPPLTIIVEKELKGNVLGSVLSEPFGVAVSRDKQIYLSDARNNRVILFDSLLNPIQQRGGFGGGAGQLNYPVYLTLDNDLNLLVAEQGNRRVSFFNSRLDYVSEIAMKDQDEPLRFGAPKGVAVRRGGEVWVSEPDNNRLDVFSAGGIFDRFMADYSAGMEGVVAPGKLVTIPGGRMIACDAGSRRLVFLDEFGVNRKQIRFSGFEHPVAAAATDDVIWVIDDRKNMLFLFSLEGTYMASYGPSFGGSGVALKNPTDVAVLSRDQLLIVDSGNDRMLLCRIFWSQDDSSNVSAH